MRVLYTDIDPFCCAVLRERVADGGLLPGEVWERDVCGIDGAEILGFTQVHLFAGIGASPLGLRWAGWPGDWSVMTGGFPCQDISSAGKGAGLDGARSGLFFEFVRLAGAFKPDSLIAENVGALSARGLDRVVGALEPLGYEVHALRLGAWAVGSPQRRERWWIVACRPVASDVGDRHKAAGLPAGPGRSDKASSQPVRSGEGGGGVPEDLGNFTGTVGSDEWHRWISDGWGSEIKGRVSVQHGFTSIPDLRTVGNPDGSGCDRGPCLTERRSVERVATSGPGPAGEQRSGGQGTERQRGAGAITDQPGACGVSLGDTSESGLEGQRTCAGQPQGSEPRYASPRRYPHPLWVDEHGEPVATPQYDWEPPRLYTRGMAGIADGIPARLASTLNKCGVAATGNAQCPEVVEVIGRAIMAAHRTAPALESR